MVRSAPDRPDPASLAFDDLPRFAPERPAATAKVELAVLSTSRQVSRYVVRRALPAWRDLLTLGPSLVSAGRTPVALRVLAHV